MKLSKVSYNIDVVSVLFQQVPLGARVAILHFLESA